MNKQNNYALTGLPVKNTPFLTGFLEGLFAGYRDRFIFVQFGMLALLLLLTIVPLFLPAPAEEAGIFDNFTIASRFIIWGLWFPLVFVSVIFFGRLWCGVLCPQGAISEYVSRWSLNLPIPEWIRWAGMPIFSFIVITIFGQVAGVRDYPWAAMEVFVGTTVLSTLIGLLFVRGKRVWCRYLCPMGPLLGIFSRLGCVGFERCGGSKSYPCPTLINTSMKTASSNCIECFRCINPEEEGTLRLDFRTPGKEILEIDEREPDIREILFLFIVTGLALSAFHWQVNPLYGDYKQSLGGLFLDMGLGSIIGKTLPWWLAVNYPEAGEVFNILDVVSISSFMLIFMVIVGASLFLLSLLSAYLLKKASGTSGGTIKTLPGVLDTVVKLGYVYAPLALTSLVIGLGQILFQSFESFISIQVIKTIEKMFFLGGAAWSGYFLWRFTGMRAAILPLFGGIVMVGFLWWSVLF